MWRQRLILSLFVFVFIAVAVRLFYFQILVGETLAQAASNQYYFTLDLLPQRGKIITSDKNPLVMNQPAYLTYAEVKKIANISEFTDKISTILELDKNDLIGRLNQEKIVWVSLKHKVEEEKRQQLENLQLTGLGFEKEGKRYYPEASMAAQLLGFLGSDDYGNDKGYFGVEGYYNRALAGKSGSLIQEKDARGYPMLLGETQRINAEDGQDLVLYLDRTVQTIIETKLEEGINKYGAKEGLIGVMDPTTGGILGMAAWPKYDPREYSKSDQNLFVNPLVADSYEPGSIFKIIVMASAINEKKVTQKTEFNEDGPIQIGEYQIKTWNDVYKGKITTAKIIETSSNPGMVQVGRLLGKENLYKYLKKFGFNDKTGVDLEDETATPLRPFVEWADIDFATVTFGQGIAVTPTQMLQAVSAIANGGKLIRPRVVREIVDATGKVLEHRPEVIREVIKPTAAKIITDIMIQAVDNGEVRYFKPKGYRIAGKTGTAQVPIKGHYDPDKTIASYIGFAPADKPKFVIIVRLTEPTRSPWGSTTAAPVFFSVAQELFTYYGIAPTN